METWNVFTPTDMIVSIVGAAGILSAAAVIAYSFNKVDVREKNIKSKRVGNLTPEDKILD